MTLSEVRQLVQRYFCGRPSLYQCRIPSGVEGRELIEGTLYRFDIVDASDLPVTLQIYIGIAQFGHLWEQEVRVLLRAGALGHPALPAVLSGGYKSGSELSGDDIKVDGFAYIVTEGSDEYLSDDPQTLLAFMEAHPVDAIRQFSLLSDALANLHSLGVVHRNLWPGTVDIRLDDKQRPQLRLSRFEMSALVENLLRSPTLDTRIGQARELVLGQGKRALSYVAPERLYQLFPVGSAGAADDQKQDVYSLGAIIWEWFLGPLPGGILAVNLDDREAVLTAHRALNEEMRRRLRVADSLPAALRRILEGMLTTDPRFRPRSSEVITDITEHYDALTGAWEGPAGQPAHLLTFVPSEFVPTLYKWDGWLENHPTTPDGRTELADRIELDLSRAVLVHSPLGAGPYVPGGAAEELRQATGLLIGRRAAWFCQSFRTGHSLSQGAPADDILIIKYVVELATARGRRLLAEFQRDRLARHIQAVEAFPFDIAASALREKRRDRPKWQPLLDATVPTVSASEKEQLFGNALDWFLDFQETSLRAREYAYELVSDIADGTPKVLRLRLDRARDDRRQLSSAMATMFASSTRRRPGFADFFADLTNEDGSGDIEVLADSNGYPSEGEFTGRVFFRRRLNDDAIEVERADTTSRIPAAGWLRPQGDVGDRVALRRQFMARSDVMRSTVLFRQLLNPMTIPGFRGRWKSADEVEADREAITDMLTCEPLYALQGPPGTGKTSVAAHAIRDMLAQEPTARILVSAQSNYSLDHLALEILGLLDQRVGRRSEIALRMVTNASADRADPAMREFLLPEVTARWQQELVASIEVALPLAERGQRDLLARWLEVARAAGPELSDRLRRAANLVFATCSATADQFLSDDGTAALFDWVVVEEAAKAWPTELAMPLVRGLRWTLIGDQRQLPAHRIEEVTDFLYACAAEADPDLQVHGRRADKYLEVFRLFQGLFEHPEPKAQGLKRPIGTLKTQFRMIDPIGAMVSRIFYNDADITSLMPGRDTLPDGWLKTGRHQPDVRLTMPGSLAGMVLAWIDTHQSRDHGDEPTWSNLGEADIIDHLVASLRPRPVSGQDGYGKSPLAIITPYRQQADLLRGRGSSAPYVSTVHAYQGKQANVVIVSLVRDTRRGAPERVAQNIGYLVQPELVNVMLSRARDVLILVGDLHHFATCGDPYWAWICAEIRAHGCVISSEKVSG